MFEVIFYLLTFVPLLFFYFFSIRNINLDVYCHNLLRSYSIYLGNESPSIFILRS